MRRVEPPHGVFAQQERLSVCEGRGGRSARSLMDTKAATVPHRGEECGATASHSLSEPHSSASSCESAIYRSRSTGNMLAIASRTSGNIFRSPVWNRRGSSSTMRYWLNENAPGPINTGVLMRKIPSATSWTFVPVMRLSFITKGVMIMEQMSKARAQAGWGKQSWPLTPCPYSHLCFGDAALGPGLS